MGYFVHLVILSLAVLVVCDAEVPEMFRVRRQAGPVICKRWCAHPNKQTCAKSYTCCEDLPKIEDPLVCPPVINLGECQRNAPSSCPHWQNCPEPPVVGPLHCSSDDICRPKGAKCCLDSCLQQKVCLEPTTLSEHNRVWLAQSYH